MPDNVRLTVRGEVSPETFAAIGWLSILVGIDWAYEEHAFFALLPDGKTNKGSFKQSQESIAYWIGDLQ